MNSKQVNSQVVSHYLQSRPKTRTSQVYHRSYCSWNFLWLSHTQFVWRLSHRYVVEVEMNTLDAVGTSRSNCPQSLWKKTISLGMVLAMSFISCRRFFFKRSWQKQRQRRSDSSPCIRLHFKKMQTTSNCQFDSDSSSTWKNIPVYNIQHIQRYSKCVLAKKWSLNTTIIEYAVFTSWIHQSETHPIHSACCAFCAAASSWRLKRQGHDQEMQKYGSMARYNTKNM